VGADSLAAWKADVDLGDFIFVHGRVISSRRGELSVLGDQWLMASKALRPLPTMHSELSEESRVRQRYVDLIVRQEARDMVRDRAAIVRAVRDTLHERGFIEIETPVLQLVHGGAAARPFPTHLNAFNIKMSLRIALELYLKRAVVGGIDKVFEMGRIFRNEGVDSTHSPEFTMLEVYEAYGDQHTMAELTQALVLAAADAFGSRVIDTPAGQIQLAGEWRWLPVYQGLSEAVGEDVTPDTVVETLRAIAARHNVQVQPQWDAGKIVVELFGQIVEPTILQPTFVCDYPPSAQPLARAHRKDPRLIEAWDLIIGGTERGTAFSELIDPVVQRERLTAQSLKAAAGDVEAMQLDEDFLRALEYGAPPMGGLGLGIDRLVMLFTNTGIRETILFPLLKPE
jgi:lysyl-tRNA synthetase class 2